MLSEQLRKTCDEQYEKLRAVDAELKGLKIPKDAAKIKRLRKRRAGFVKFLADNCPDYLGAVGKRLKTTADKQVEL